MRSGTRSDATQTAAVPLVRSRALPEASAVPGNMRTVAGQRQDDAGTGTSTGAAAAAAAGNPPTHVGGT